MNATDSAAEISFYKKYVISIKASGLLLGYLFWLTSGNILIIKPTRCTSFLNLFLE
jgi:hypothetical protein